MGNVFKDIQRIAISSLMPDFFAVRIDEDGHFDKLKELIVKIKLPTPLPQLEQIKEISLGATTATEFMDGLKAKGLWNTFKEIITNINVG